MRAHLAATLSCGLLAAALAGCRGPALPARAADCWGTGAAGEAACHDQLGARLASIGAAASTLDGLRAQGACDGLATGLQSGATEDDAPPRVAGQGEAAPARTEERAQPGDALPSPLPTAEPPSPSPGETPPPVALRTPEPARPTPREDVGGAACAGMSISALHGKASHTPEEIVCLQDTARGRLGASDPEVQEAAVTLYNHRASGWADAVEAALSRPSLANAPALNFAGLKPAYDGGRYSVVMRRASTVWSNLDKGYSLSSGDRSFVAQFACRSATQLALSGKDPGDGATWCDRWMDLARRAGEPTDPIQDLLDQLE